MKKFWDFIRDDAGERVLRLEGPIDEDSFWGDEVTPAMFREELEAEEGDVTVYINSPGGNVFAAAQIYTMLLEHKGKITVKIDAIAASAASVIAMAGDLVLMSPVAMLLIHDPMTIAMGNAKDMEKAIETLNEVKASIINAYQAKSGLSRNRISQFMEDETWLNARRAVELGFADGIIERPASKAGDSVKEKDDEKEAKASAGEWQPYSTRTMGQTILNRLVSSHKAPAGAGESPAEAKSDGKDVEPAGAGMAEEKADTVKPLMDVSKPKKPGSGGDDDPDEDDDPDSPDTDDDPDEPDDPDKDDDPDSDDPDEPDEPDTDGLDEKRKPSRKGETAPSNGVKPAVPVIGMDGKTKDGAMPYELLKKQLEFLR